MLARLFTVIAVAGVLLAAFAPSALAQACEGRPGASAIEQYCEAIPEATGDRVTPRENRERGSSGADVPSGTSQQLEDSGADGAAVLGLVAGSDGGNGGDGGGNGASSSKSSSGESASGDEKTEAEAAAVAAASSPSDNPLKAVSSAVSNGATVGSAFLWGLLALAVAAAGAAWVGFRRQAPPE